MVKNLDEQIWKSKLHDYHISINNKLHKIWESEIAKMMAYSAEQNRDLTQYKKVPVV